MWKERLKRIAIILLVAFLVFFAGKVFANWQMKKKVAGEKIALPTQQIGEKIIDFGEKVLGEAVEVLPGGKGLKEKIVTKDESFSNTPITNQNVAQTDEAVQTQKVERVETKTQEIVEILKELPAQELENIKKQIFKDFCQKILEEK